MKKVLLFLLTALMALTFATTAAAFTDIADETTAIAVDTLHGMGIVTGTSATKYSPALTLTRAQICTMIIRLEGMEAAVGSYTTQNLFTDVKNGMWHAGYVNLAYRKNLINGYGNGKFGPDDEVTYGQFVTILLRTLGYTENDIGKLWPADYIVFADDLGISDGVSLNADDKVTRGDAAILFYNTLQTTKKGATGKYYRSIGGYASEATVILLDNAVADSTAGDLYACVLSGSGAEMRYYTQKNVIADRFVGSLGSLLLNNAGKVIGFLEESEDVRDIVVKEAKLSGVTAADGKLYRLDSGVSVISDGAIYPYGATGYVKVHAHAGGAARFYYDENGSVAYIYLNAATDPATTSVAVAVSEAPAAELAKALGVSAPYSILKNGGMADTAALAVYDVAYYDETTGTLRVSDHKITGYIEYATPSVGAAEYITVSGCEIPVLQCAWDSLSGLTLGGYVTALLTDTGYVAAVYPAETVSADLFGILSANGDSITLTGSGLTMRPKDISANTVYNGSLVQIDTSDSDRVVCTGVGKTITSGDVVDLTAGTVGGIPLASGCSIYEWSGSGYVYSLTGEQNAASTDFDAIRWTDRLSHSYVSFYHKNAAGLVDILVLKDVTGNYYRYGELTFTRDAIEAYHALSIKNTSQPNGSTRYICTTGGNGFAGIALAAYSKNYTKVADIVWPTVVKKATPDRFVLSAEDEWSFTVGETAIPVSDKVEVCIKTTGKWQSGEEGLLTALSSELVMHVYYDRTPETGAQVRMIVLDVE